MYTHEIHTIVLMCGSTAHQHRKFRFARLETVIFDFVFFFASSFLWRFFFWSIYEYCFLHFAFSDNYSIMIWPWIWCNSDWFTFQSPANFFHSFFLAHSHSLSLSLLPVLAFVRTCCKCLWIPANRSQFIVAAAPDICRHTMRAKQKKNRNLCTKK